MKIRTYISKYHFLRIASLLIALMWQVNVQAQADSTVTYTFNDTTMTFNIEAIRASLLHTTDLSPEEVEATLVYEPFWRSLFPPVESASITQLLIPNAGRVEEDACIGFSNVITNGEGEVTGVSPWATECACASGIVNMNTNEEVEAPYTYHSISWTPGIDCYTGDCPQGDNSDACEQVLVQSQNAFEVIQRDPMAWDPYVRRNGQANVIQMVSPIGSEQFIRIGDQVGGSHVHRMKGTFSVNADNPILKYSYAVAMQDTRGNNDDHGPLTLYDEQGNIHTGRPYLTVRFKSLTTGDDVTCGDYSVIGVGSPNSALETTGIRIGSEERNFAGMAINWTTNTVDLSEYVGEIEVEITLAECNQGGHTAWAYLDFSCEEAAFEVAKEGDGCTYNFTTAYTGNYGDYASYEWTFMDEAGNELSTSNNPDPSFTYDESGTYEVQLDITYCNFSNGNADLNCEGSCEECGGSECTVTFTETITICCDYCASDFAPNPGSEYVISAWVKEDISNVRTYDSPNITLQFEGAPTAMEGPFKPSGAIIDGWQRIEAVFDVPLEAEKIKIQLNNSGDKDVYFDDVRIHPFDASMKSFVYDPVTLRLSAELDERNYATYYEYDEEGALIRIKKETERGIMTIQEARNGIRKVND